MNTEIKIGTMTAAWMPAELRERSEAAAAAANAFNVERQKLGRKAETIREIRPLNFVEDRPLDGQSSWIQEHTFTDPEQACRELAEMQRQRVSLPIRGLALVREVETIRDAVQNAWAEHKAGLERALKDAESKARSAAAKLPVSAALQEQHVMEVTEAARKAAAARNPCPADWPRWGAGTLRAARETLLTELRAAFAAALR